MGDPQQFPSVAQMLLEHGAEVTIYAAVAFADAPRIHQLVSAEPGLLRRIGTWSGGLLTLAVKYGHTEIVRLLLDIGADVDERTLLEELEEPTLSWGMPLWHAAQAGNFEISKLLLDRGADPDGNVYASGWPLSRAWNHKDDSVKRLLLERGARMQPHLVSSTHNVEEAKRLLAEEPKEQVVHELLWAAADYGCAAIVELALPYMRWAKDDPRWHWVLIQPIRGASGDSAKNQGHVESMAALLRHGIDPNVTRTGHTVLHFAAGWHGAVSDEDRARVASMLINYGARLDLRDDLLKSTPLGWGCRWGRVELVKTLLERGADPVEADAEDWARPMAWAEKMGRVEVCVVLEEYLND